MNHLREEARNSPSCSPYVCLVFFSRSPRALLVLASNCLTFAWKSQNEWHLFRRLCSIKISDLVYLNSFVIILSSATNWFKSWHDWMWKYIEILVSSVARTKFQTTSHPQLFHVYFIKTIIAWLTNISDQYTSHFFQQRLEILKDSKYFSLQKNHVSNMYLNCYKLLL